MAHDQEREIRLAFLEEAQDYLNTIEGGIIGVATQQVDNQTLDAVLRAAHSIKGGAAMMGFQTLSDLAHRLEDFFKVLRTQNFINQQVERLLLTAVGYLRDAIAVYHQGAVVDQQWLDTYINPVWHQLEQHLGTYVPTDDSPTMLAPTDAQDMIVLVFETEVTECLQRLITVLATADTTAICTETLTIAQDFASLGEMFELSAFKSLCTSVIEHLTMYPTQVTEIANLALQAWKQSQAAILTNQVDTLPTQINLNAASDDFFAQISAADIGNLTTPPDADAKTVELAIAPPSATPNSNDHPDTVRVPVKLLDKLNDLFEELTIERSSLNLYLERARNLVKILERRVRNLKIEPQIPTPTTDLFITSPDIPNIADTATPVPPNSTEMQLLVTNVAENIVRIKEVTADIDISLEDTAQTVSELNRTAKQLHTSLTQVRMRPLADLLNRFPRFLRELSLQYDKNVNLKITGGETLIDRTILEALSDPLMHLLRNAFDHGIEDVETRRNCGKPEQGVIEINATSHNQQTLITVSDDGGGIDLEKIRQKAQQLGYAEAIANDQELLSLIFEPSFSTANQVTALSGRGVGLDVVRTNLKAIRGNIKVDTQLGKGTTFTLSVPLTLSVAKVLIVESNGILLALPTDAIAEMLIFNPAQVSTIVNQEVFSCEGYTMPLIRISDWLEIRCTHQRATTQIVPSMGVPAVLKIVKDNHWVGIFVDRCWGEQEVAIRQVAGAIAMPTGFNGCGILGDGRVVPLVSAPELLQWISEQQSTKNQATAPNFPNKDTILLVDDSLNVRRLLALTLENAGYRVEQAQDGQEALEKLRTDAAIKAVICDIDMPRVDGYGVLAQVKSNPQFSKLPIIMLTSRQGNKDKELAINLGATAYFTKPFNEQELLKTLKPLIEN